MRKIDIDHLLPFVSKPSRYIDHEINAIKKAPSKVNICLAFPDVYEIGISHLGLKILYSIVNDIDACMADRAYLPWVDLMDKMIQEETPLFSWENRLAVADFDLLGITLQSELTFSNVIAMIDLCQLKVLSQDRSEEDPIIIAGGPCASNPLPLKDFIDVFVIGEAEDLILEMMKECLANQGKTARLLAFAQIKGCYVPQLHDRQPDKSILARKYMGFASSDKMHEKQLLPWQLATHNRYVAEIMRGCTRGCRFCHAGYFYRPVRERSPEDILNSLLQEVKNSGWDEAGLVSLSSSDYSCIKDLLKALLTKVNTDKTHISLPSLRVDALDNELISLMHNLGREGLTIAPEAGSQRLRNIINKNLSETEILEGVEIAVRLGWQKLKLYFMIGLPGEREDDIDETIALIAKIDALAKRKLQINITLSPFVPKPFTPFQWSAMANPQTVLSRCLKIKHHFIKKKFIKIKYHTIENSLLEAHISRADASFGRVIHRAWQLGARYDAWRECFDYSLWEMAMQETAYDPEQIYRPRELSEPLPWDFIDIGVSKDFLIAEYHHAQAAELTEDCREHCISCGVCKDEIRMDLQSSNPIAIQESIHTQAYVIEEKSIETRYRLFYRKIGSLRFVAHLDWMRMLFRLISMIPLKVVYTQGFNPHPKVSLCPPLPLGVSGCNEFFDLSVPSRFSPEDVVDAFAKLQIPDFAVFAALPLNVVNQIPLTETLSIAYPIASHDDIFGKVAAFNDSLSLLMTKEKKGTAKTYELKRIIHSLHLEQAKLICIKAVESPGLLDVLAYILGTHRDELYRWEIERLGFDLEL